MLGLGLGCGCSATNGNGDGSRELDVQGCQKRVIVRTAFDGTLSELIL